MAVLFAPYIRRRRRLSVYHIVAQKRTKVTMKRAISLERVESFPGTYGAQLFANASRVPLLHPTRLRATRECMYIYLRQADKPCATSSFINKYELSPRLRVSYLSTQEKEKRDRMAGKQQPAREEISRHSSDNT